MKNRQFDSLLTELKNKEINFFELWSKEHENYTLKLMGFAKTNGKDHILVIFQLWKTHGYDMFIQSKGINVTNDIKTIIDLL